MNKAQWKVLAIGIPGIIVFAFFSSYYIDTYNSLDKVNRIYMSELFAACIAIAIFATKKIFKTNLLEPYELLMIIIIGAIAGVNLIPPELFDATWVIVSSIFILTGWFLYFGLGKYLDKKIDSGTFRLTLLFFIGLTIVIILAFNIHRISTLYSPIDI